MNYLVARKYVDCYINWSPNGSRIGNYYRERTYKYCYNPSAAVDAIAFLMPKIVVIESVRDLPENDIANILKIPSRYTGEF
jgi:hypothetical protein